MQKKMRITAITLVIASILVISSTSANSTNITPILSPKVELTVKNLPPVTNLKKEAEKLRLPNKKINELHSKDKKTTIIQMEQSKDGKSVKLVI